MTFKLVSSWSRIYTIHCIDVCLHLEVRERAITCFRLPINLCYQNLQADLGAVCDSLISYDDLPSSGQRCIRRINSCPGGLNLLANIQPAAGIPTTEVRDIDGEPGIYGALMVIFTSQRLPCSPIEHINVYTASSYRYKCHFSANGRN